MPGPLGFVAVLISSAITATMVILAVRSLFHGIQAKAEPMVGGIAGQSTLKSRLDLRFSAAAQQVFKPKSDDELAQQKLSLAQAGLQSQRAPERYALIQFYCLVLGGIVVIPWLMLGNPTLALFGLSISMMVAFVAPRAWLSYRRQSRRTKISLSIASTLDLLVTCMEAGLGLEQAIARVAAELKFSEPEMAEELNLTLTEMQAGMSTAQAFRKLSQRVDLEEMHMICSIIIQSFSLGAGIGQMLRQYAASWRSQRMIDLEEKAGKATAALTLPLALCLLPSSMLAMLGPAVIAVTQNMAL